MANWKQKERILLLVLEVLMVFADRNNPPIVLSINGAIVKSEDTKIGSVIGQITATDNDGPKNITFTVQTGKEFVNLTAPRRSKTNNWTVDIILISKLDRDWGKTEQTLVFKITDSENEIIKQVILYIQDVNDNAPEFRKLPYKATVSEDAVKNTLIKTVTASDPDNGPGGTVTYSMKAIAQAPTPEYSTKFRIDTVSNLGEIKLNEALDYETHTFYQFEITATDGGNLSSKADFVVTVLDVQDTPPRFVNLPYSIQILENVSVGTKVLQVTAIDGDRGVSNSLTYKFVDGKFENFLINRTSGWITVKNTLDRDSKKIQNTGGVYAMTIMAEEGNETQPQHGNTTAITLVKITVLDINDNGPQFNNQSYTASIMENLHKGVPISFSAGTNMNVTDRDQGRNSHFVLTVEKNNNFYYDFAPLQREVFGETTVLLRVNNSSILDYETTKFITFQVVAREVETAERRSSTATVSLTIEDMNDNAPVFSKETYLETVREDAILNFSISTIAATDADTGSYGEITYLLKGDNSKFSVSPKTGVISVNGILDRELRDAYYMTLEAKDGGGFRTAVPLTINIEDVNDNAPIFKRTDYGDIVQEGKTRFSRRLAVEAMDNDKPGTNNSQVKYKIASASRNLHTNFSINEDTGEITLNSALDYEKLDKTLRGKIILSIICHDLGVPQKSSTTNLTVTVEDENDNAPTFLRPLYKANVSEGATPGTNVTRVKAVDADTTSPNNEIIYRIDNGALDKFRIDAITGIISIEHGATLDRENKDSYILNLSAIDKGTPPNSGKSLVVINITDENDENPYFENSTPSVSVKENQMPSTILLTVTAKDDDENSGLKYSVMRQDIQAFNENNKAVDAATLQTVRNYFDVYPDNGTVYVNTSLDRETAEMVVLPILVTDTNSRKAVQTATVLLKITILDVNDNSPDFLRNNYSRNVSEDLPLDAEVFRVVANDKDKNQAVSFRIGSNINGYFKIEPSGQQAGAVRLHKKLDREKVEFLQFTILAIDNAPLPLTSTTTVHIKVVDSNDNKPEFFPANSTYWISEDATVGMHVCFINATDKDTGIFGKIFFSLEKDNMPLSFSINETTGEIKVAQQLDRETKASYPLVIIVKDNKPDSKNQRTNHKRITVNLLDVNDNAPAFIQKDSQIPQIQETASIGSVIFTVSAQDPDDGDNGKIEFTLGQSTNATGLFAIDPTTGDIQLNSSLQENIGVYYLTVIAMDKGNPAKSNSTVVFLEVLDVNLHNPKFVNPSTDSPIVQVREEQANGSLIMQVSATDDDHGLNGQVKYELLLDNKKDWKKFHLDKDTGQLINTAILDREKQKTYVLQVEAYDLGKETRNSRVHLTIELLDMNDNPPLFNKDKYHMPYVLSVEEEQDSAYVGSVAIAEDSDSGNNSQICYYIKGGEKSNHFSLSKTSGKLYLQKKLDREEVPNVNLVIQASEHCYRSISGSRKKREVAHPSDYNSSDPSLLWVKVQLKDINDNPPVFKSKDISVGVTRDTQFGTTIHELKYDIEDKDIGNNSIPYFRLNGKVKISKSLENKIETDRPPFLLLKNGSVKTNMYFQTNMEGHFLLPLVVADIGGYNSTAVFTIHLISNDQRIKVIFRLSAFAVRGLKDPFTLQLQNSTGYKIIVDKIQTHENALGKPEVDKTDMLIHGIDLKTNEVVDAKVLLRAVDFNTANLVSILNNYNVLEIVPYTSPPDNSTTERDLKLALILIVIILLVLLFILIAIFYMSRQKYIRKLKAATGKSYHYIHKIAPLDTDLRKGDVPGTNIHSYENANPIYLEKIIMADLDDDGPYSLGEADSKQNNGYDEREISLDLYDDEMDYLPMSSSLSSSDCILAAALYEHDISKKSQLNEVLPTVSKSVSNSYSSRDSTPSSHPYHRNATDI